MTINNSRMQKRKRKKRNKIILFILLPILLVFLAGGYYVTQLLSTAESVIKDSYENYDREKPPTRPEKVDPEVDNVSILIMGIDENEKRANREIARTDALILATFNKNQNSIKLLSIPRDSYVYIPEVDKKDKINHAHAFGGPKATVETVENLFEGVPVDYWVRLNFEAFVNIIDTLGGVKVDVPYEFKESDSMDKRDAIHLFPGLQTLNGEEALAFARTRKHDNDIERGKRQLEIIKSILDKTISIQSIGRYHSMIRDLDGQLTMNIEWDELKSFISYGLSGHNLDIESSSLDGDTLWIDRIYYWQLDEEDLTETTEDLKKHLEIESDFTSDKEQEGLTTEEDQEGLEENTVY